MLLLIDFSMLYQDQRRQTLEMEQRTLSFPAVEVIMAWSAQKSVLTVIASVEFSFILKDVMFNS